MPSYDFARVSFDEAIAHFRQKTNTPTSTWRDIWAAENETAFGVAGAMAEDLIADLRKAVDKGIAQGTTRQEFLRDFEKIVADTGWAYRGGKAWRAGVIWQTNMRSAYRAGQRQRQREPEVLAQRQFLQWLHGGTPHPRPLHKSLHRKVVPADQGDSLYRIIGGFGCQCEIVSVSQRDIDREGLVVDDAPTVGDSLVLRDNRGREVTVRVEADPGWDYLPGESPQDAGQDPPPGVDRANPDAYYESEAAKVFRDQVLPKLDVEPVRQSYQEIERKAAEGILADEFNRETRRLRAEAAALEETKPGTASKLRKEAGGRMFLSDAEIRDYLRNETAERFGESVAERYRRLARQMPDAIDPRTIQINDQEKALAQLRVDVESPDWRPDDPSWGDEYDLDDPKDLAKVKREVIREAEEVKFDRQDVTDEKLWAIQQQIESYLRGL